MRRYVVALAFASASAVACSGPQVDVAAETEAVRARSRAIVAAEAAQDVDAALAFWAPDAVAQPAGAPQAQGHDAIRALYGQFFDTGQLKELEGTTSYLVVSQGGDLAYEYGVNRMVFTGPEGDLLDMGKYLAVWQKIEGEWYVAALSFTSDAPAPTPIATN
ncbi:MAG TPA: nuclear transport factor 2 family protein [Gemmatimonadota bacterium]|nr:nuclear transport factor 2 family protein [Gemmatimonadota bacterium]